MKVKVTVILALLILTGTSILLSEDLPVPQEAASASTPKTGNDLNTQWAWGEVVNVDAQNKSVTIKYLDYELDQEKELSLTTDDSTTYDNIKSFGEIQPKDNLSIDYVTVEGKNIAKSISLEKPEAAPVANKAKPTVGTTAPVSEEKQPAASSSTATSPQEPDASVQQATQAY